MTSQAIAQQVQRNTAAQRSAPDAETQVREAIKRKLPAIKALLPDVLDERKLAALVMTEVLKTPKLAACTEESLIGCVLRAAALGLQFGQDLGQAYLIPRGRDCTLLIGYRGVIALAQRSGAIRSISTRCVYEGDTFAYAYGLNEHLDHTPILDSDRTAEQITHAYAVVHYTNGGHDFEVLDRAQVEARRRRGGDGPAWKSDWAKMAEKSAILAMRARLPLTTEVATAFAQDGAAITVSSRGPAALVADHGDQVALEPPRQVDTETGQVSREEPPPPPPTTPADPHQQKAPDDTGPISADDAQALHKTLGQMGIADKALHQAVILRASVCRTSHAGQLTEREARTVINHARACVAEPSGLVQWCLHRLPSGGDEAAALQAWLDAQPADPS